MPQFYPSISPNLAEWAMAQPVFFTASAPLAGSHINVSPKGLPASTFTIFDGNSAAYVDATGSGSETISHIYENGRVTIMFCSFEKSPRIMRFFCTGRVIEYDSPEFERTLAKMGKSKLEGARAVIMLDVWKVQTSCGYGVPIIATEKLGDVEKATDAFIDRETLGHWASKKVEKNELMSYQVEWNTSSLDGLTGLRAARRDRGEVLWLTDAAATLRRFRGQSDAVMFGVFISIVLFLLVKGLSYLLFTR